MKITADFKKIKGLRETKGWTQEQLSELAGVSLRTIQRVEKNGSCSTETIKAIAEVFEMDFKEVMAAKDSKRFEEMEFLNRLTLGKQLFDIVGDNHAYDLDFEAAITNPEHLRLVSSFFEEVKELGEFWNDIGTENQFNAINTFQDWIDRLSECDLWVFGGRTKQPYGEFEPPLIFDVMALRVYTQSSAVIITIDLDKMVEEEI